MSTTAALSNQSEPLVQVQAFYVKCWPQDADVEALVRSNNRVFIGYPPWKRDGQWDVHNVAGAMLDISVPQEHWHPDLMLRDVSKREVNRNRKIAAAVCMESFAVIPRPRKGICLIGLISGPFELVNDPPWAEEYLQLREQQGLGRPNQAEEQWHIGDVVQTWPAENFKEVPFPVIPRWISYSLLSRNTVGWIRDCPDGRRAADVLGQLYKGTYKLRLQPTKSENEVASRLLDWVSPSILEHLMVDLLQIEEGGTHWFHTGGTGDGGVDGMAISDSASVTAVLLCKWKFDGDLVTEGRRLLNEVSQKWPDARVHVAVLHHHQARDLRTDGIEGLHLWDRTNIAHSIIKHSRCLPLARALGVQL